MSHLTLASPLVSVPIQAASHRIVTYLIVSLTYTFT